MLKEIRRLPVICLGALVLACGTASAASGEVSGFGGLVSVSDGGGTHGNAGGSGGVNLGKIVHLFGELNYMSLGSASYSEYYSGISTTATARGKLINYGGGVGFRIPTGNKKVEPYCVVTFGYGQQRITLDASATSYYGNATYSDSTTTGNGYSGFGAGARIYMSSKWGVKPEVRYQKYFGIDSDSRGTQLTDRGSVVTLTGGVFFRFGGE